MQLGAFSISLTVNNLDASIAFYKDLGFEDMGGSPEHGYVMLKNENHIIGLFQGMFERNMLTFNPGWDQSSGSVDPFLDVRDIKASMIAAGHEISQESGGETGPASFVVIDPDGNPVLIDQHR